MDEELFAAACQPAFESIHTTMLAPGLDYATAADSSTPDVTLVVGEMAGFSRLKRELALLRGAEPLTSSFSRYVTSRSDAWVKRLDQLQKRAGHMALAKSVASGRLGIGASGGGGGGGGGGSSSGWTAGAPPQQQQQQHRPPSGYPRNTAAAKFSNALPAGSVASGKGASVASEGAARAQRRSDWCRSWNGSVCAHVVQRGFCGFAHDNGPYDTMLDSTNRRPKLRSEREAAASSAPPS